MTTPPNIQKLLEGKLSIPTLPHIVLQVHQLVHDPKAGTREIGELVAVDAALAARVLRMANSAYYGLSGRCLSAEHACTVLGMDVLRNIIIQTVVVRAYGHLKSVGGFDVDEIWSHSLHAGQVSWVLSQHAGVHLARGAEDFYMCGLLHDIGKIVMLDTLGDPYVAALLEAGADREALPGIERRLFGFDHADAGAYVAKRWGLPEVVRETVQFHHGPMDKIVHDPTLAVVVAAAEMVHVARAGESLEPLHHHPAVLALKLSDESFEAVTGYAQDTSTQVSPWDGKAQPDDAAA